MAAKPYVDNVVREIRATAAAAAATEEELKKLPGSFAGDGGCALTRPGGGEDGDATAGGGDQHATSSSGVKTLFFGGGTPSLCPPELVGVLIETVRQSYGIAVGAEISMEMDPGTFDEVRRRLCYW